ncbi:MAG: putative lipid II flippase FtsW [Gammaproteobacteria bacterium]|nr:putative lipid II flippase FtsW [Gammaproteobacteria bacterium]
MIARLLAHGQRAVRGDDSPGVDMGLLYAVMITLGFGLVMMASASFGVAERELGQPSYYLMHQIAYIGVSALAGFLIYASLSLEFLERHSGKLLIAAFALLILVLMPGVGREVNGSTRWLSLGVARVQPSEFAKLFTFIYLAGYLVRRGDEVRNAVRGFAKPMAVLAVLCVLLLAEPDFGAAAVLMGTAMGMMLLGGVRIWQFGVLLVFVLCALAVLAVSSPYRMARVTAFLNPWADPFASGFQLTQALIAFGRGEWFGVGLGGSIQKLFYLPEAHTDFLFAVIAEELGLAGSVAVIALFTFIVAKSFMIARRAEQAGKPFAAYLASGLGLWFGLQAYTNIAVNMGLLPTKGLTLPLMSYGGSSMLAACISMGLLLRIDLESRRVLQRHVGAY